MLFEKNIDILTRQMTLEYNDWSYNCLIWSNKVDIFGNLLQNGQH